MNEENDAGSDSDPSGDNMDSKELMLIVQRSEARKSAEIKSPTIRRKRATKAPKRTVMKLPHPLPALNPQDRLTYNSPALVDLLENVRRFKYGQRHFLNSSNDLRPQRPRTDNQRNSLKSSTTKPRSHRYKDYGSLSRTEYGGFYGESSAKEYVADRVPLAQFLSIIGNNTSHMPSGHCAGNARKLPSQETGQQLRRTGYSPSKYLSADIFHRSSCLRKVSEKASGHNRRQASISLKSKASFSWYNFIQSDSRTNIVSTRIRKYVPRNEDFKSVLFSPSK